MLSMLSMHSCYSVLIEFQGNWLNCLNTSFAAGYMCILLFSSFPFLSCSKSAIIFFSTLYTVNFEPTPRNRFPVIVEAIFTLHDALVMPNSIWVGFSPALCLNRGIRFTIKHFRYYCMSHNSGIIRKIQTFMRNIFIECFLFVFYREKYTKYIPRKVYLQCFTFHHHQRQSNIFNRGIKLCE